MGMFLLLNNMKDKLLKNKKAFTLVELLIAISLFSIIAFISMGAIITIFDANKNSQASKTVVDSLNFNIDDMARTIRFGNSYDCGGISTPANPNDCSLGSSELALIFDGDNIIYRLNSGAIQKSSDGGYTYSNITSSDVVIDYLRFYVFGSSFGDINQPFVLAVIKGYVSSKPTAQSRFMLQTIMSQRALDI